MVKKKSWAKDSKKRSPKEEQEHKLGIHRKEVQDLMDMKTKLLAQVASQEKRKDNLATTIREECRNELHRISQMQITLSANQTELNRLIEQNKALNKNLLQEKKEMAEIQERVERAEQRAEEQRKKYLSQMAQNDQYLAGERADMANETAGLNDRENELNQREYRVNNKEKESSEREAKTRRDEIVASAKTNEARELERNVKETTNSMMQEAERAKTEASSLKKKADGLMLEANKKMADALKKEEANDKERAILKARDVGLDKLNAKLNEQKISQGEYDRYLGLLKRETDKKIAILKKLREEKG